MAAAVPSAATRAGLLQDDAAGPRGHVQIANPRNWNDGVKGMNDFNLNRGAGRLGGGIPADVDRWVQAPQFASNMVSHGGGRRQAAAFYSTDRRIPRAFARGAGEEVVVMNRAAAFDDAEEQHEKEGARD